jgi:hypothetical protein
VTTTNRKQAQAMADTTTNTTEEKPEQQLTVGELLDSLTGFEENQIEEKFSMLPGTILTQGFGGLQRLKRALLFIYRLRKDPKSREERAYQSVMNMTSGELQKWYKPNTDPEDDDAEDDDDAVDPMTGEPLTETGKDDKPAD